MAAQKDEFVSSLIEKESFGGAFAEVVLLLPPPKLVKSEEFKVLIGGLSLAVRSGNWGLKSTGCPAR